MLEGRRTSNAAEARRVHRPSHCSTTDLSPVFTSIGHLHQPAGETGPLRP